MSIFGPEEQCCMLRCNKQHICERQPQSSSIIKTKQGVSEIITMTNHHNHLFYQNLTFEFIQSCTRFVFQENECPPSPRRRLLFEEDDNLNPNSTTYHLDVDESKNNYGDKKKKSIIGGHNSEVPFLNLVCDNEEKYDEDSSGSIANNDDPWMKDAWKLSMIIQQHSKLINEYYSLYTNQYIVLQSNNDTTTNDDDYYDDDNLENTNDLTMSNEETYNFESQLVSFITSTTKQIENLRQLNNNTSLKSSTISSSIYHHRNGIITNLFSELKIVMNVYSEMQSVRHRHSLMILDHPYKVCLYPVVSSVAAVGNTTNSSSNNSMGETKSSMDVSSKNEPQQTKLEPLPEFHYTEEDEYQFKQEQQLQGGEYEKEMEEFLFKYDDENDSDESLLHVLNTPLPSLPLKMSSEEKIKIASEKRMTTSSSEERPENTHVGSLPIGDETKDMSNYVKENEKDPLPLLGDKKIITNSSSLSSAFQYDPATTTTNNNSNNIQQQLEQETILLTHKIQNESLDSIHKVENQMIQITSLLNQFTSLINDQQVEIEMIHENTMKSKDNVEKGSEQLIQAKESKKRSRHYFALIIVWMGLCLLFLNAIMP